MKQFEKAPNLERRNYFHLVGRPANLNDRMDSYFRFSKKVDDTPPAKEI
jgi:hypothetical protein